MATLCITSSGTELGKTFVTAVLIRQLRAHGYRPCGLKPVVSGFSPDTPELTDTGILLDALGLPLSDDNLEAVSPWRFQAPLAPDMAAARERKRIPFDALVEFCRRPRPADVTLIEGAGGVMAPLDDGHTVLDLLRALAAPTLLVVGSYLGSISHTLTAAATLAAHRVPLLGVIVNQSPIEPVPLEETAAAIQRFVPASAVLTMTRKKVGSDWRAPDLIPLLASYLKPR